MKLFRFALNIWITIVSVLSFLIGWVALAHAPKPVSQSQAQSVAVSSAALPTLVPLQNLQFGSDNNFQGFQVQTAPQTSSIFGSAPSPLFRTGGS